MNCSARLHGNPAYRRFALALALSALVFIPAMAGDAGPPMALPVADLFPGVQFDPTVPAQAKLFGFQPGERPMRHHELVEFMRALADSSPRAELREYARTYEGRPLVYLAISDEKTISRLRGFHREHARLVDPRERAVGDDAALIEQAKAVAWMAYSIHGNEVSGTDASAALAYWLVAGEDELAQKLRRELVILIDPCENPDGRERFLAQTTSFAHAVPSPDKEDLSHGTVWPWGRGNHYLFDLNRDWFSMVQPESARSEIIASWNPQLMVDAHEMGADATYLFSPPRHPYNPHLPVHTLDWAEPFAEDQAKGLDARGYSYYTGEWNEEFFPGYGSSWASYMGAIGILYEMSGTQGTLVRQRAGTLRSFAQAVEHQLASSVANLGTLADNRAKILTDYVNARRETVKQGQEGPVGAWVLPCGRYPQRTNHLVGLLRSQGIEVLRATSSPPQVRGLRDARTAEDVDAKTLPDATWMVPLDQPAGNLVRVLLDPHVPMEAEFFREEREYLERGKGTRLYETTAWSMPLAMGIEAYWTAERPDSGWSDEPLPEVEFAFESSPATFGYVMPGTSDASVFALADMLQRGLAVRVAGKPVEVGGQKLERGAILIKREGNPDDLERQLMQVSARWEVSISAVTTAKATEGPDLGGRHFRALQAPRIGIWSGMPVAPSAYGALWHLLDREADLRFTGLDLARFGRTDLTRYNVLVFPAVFGGYRGVIGEGGVEKLKDWVKAGGTAIGIGGGASFLADTELGLTKTRLRSQALDRFPPVVLGIAPGLAEEGGLFRAVGIRAAADEQDDEQDAKGGRDDAEAVPESPYDIAPILGAGARPFAEGFEQGTPASSEPVDLAEWLKPFLPPGQAKPEKEDLERADARLRQFAARGVFLRADVDQELWLAWGLPEELPVLASARDALVAEPPVQVPARYADVDRLHLGGLLWPETAGRRAHTAYVTREGVGRGQVILFLSPPEFRGWTLGTRRLLMNALLYGPGLGTRWPTPW